MPDPQEEFQEAQARPNLYDKVPGAAPLPPSPPTPSRTPGGTPIGTPGGPTPDSYFEKEEPEIAERKGAFGGSKGREATRMLQGINKEMTGKGTIDIPDDHGRNTQYPMDKDELDSWYSYLGKRHQEQANELQEYFQKKGYKGFFDPAIKGKDLVLRNYLFDQTSGQWRRQIEPNKKPKSGGSTGPAEAPDPNDPEKFFGGAKSKRKRSELKDDAPAIASMGGNYMGGEDA